MNCRCDDDNLRNRSKHALNSCEETSSSPNRCPARKRALQSTRLRNKQMSRETSSALLFFCPLPLLCRRFMTRRRFLLAYIRRVAISTFTRLLVLLKLFFNRRNLRISNFLVVLMTSGACGDRNIGQQAAQRARASNVYVASRAFHHVAALTAFMSELERNAFGPDCRHERDPRFVTSGTVIARRLQILPMTVETGVVRVRRCLKGPRGRDKRLN